MGFDECNPLKVSLLAGDLRVAMTMLQMAWENNHVLHFDIFRCESILCGKAYLKTSLGTWRLPEV